MSDIKKLTFAAQLADIRSRPPLVRNAIRCLVCGDTIESKRTHDFRKCSCRSVAVDGGLEYQRLIGEPTDYVSLAEFGPPDLSLSIAYLQAAAALLDALGKADPIDEAAISAAYEWVEAARARVERAGNE